MSSHLHEQVANLDLPSPAEQLLAEIAEPIARESLRDFLVNRSFRRDLFVRDAPPLDPAERWERLMAVQVHLLKPPDCVELRRRVPVGDCDLRPEIYRPLLDELAGGPRALGELVATLVLRGIDAGQILEAVVLLTAFGDTGVAIGLDGAVSSIERHRRAARFNDVVLDRSRFDEQMLWLASPMVAGGVTADILDQLFLLALRRGEEPAGFAHRSLWGMNRRLRQADGAAFDDEAAMRQEALRQWQIAQHSRLPVWRGLGIA